MFGYLVLNCWSYLDGLRGIVLLEEECHGVGEGLRLQKPTSLLVSSLCPMLMNNI